MEGSNRIFIVLLPFSKNEGKEYFMKISEIKIEALKLMFVGGSQVLLPENLYIYKNDESFGFYLVRMNGAINRCFSRLEAMGVLPPRVDTLSSEEARSLGKKLEYILSSFPVSEFLGVVQVDLSTGERRELFPDEFEYIAEEDIVLLDAIEKDECYKIKYRPKLKRLTEVSDDGAVCEVPDYIASLIPLYIKSELYSEDEPGAAAEARNLFEASLEKIKDNEEKGCGAVRTVYAFGDI